MDILDINDANLEKELSMEEEMAELEKMIDLTARRKTQPAPVARQLKIIEALPQKPSRDPEPVILPDLPPPLKNCHKKAVNEWKPKPQAKKPKRLYNRLPVPHRIPVAPQKYEPFLPLRQIQMQAPPVLYNVQTLQDRRFRPMPRNRREARYFQHLDLVRERGWNDRTLRGAPSKKLNRRAERAARWRAAHGRKV